MDEARFLGRITDRLHAEPEDRNGGTMMNYEPVMKTGSMRSLRIEIVPEISGYVILLTGSMRSLRIEILSRLLHSELKRTGSMRSLRIEIYGI